MSGNPSACSTHPERPAIRKGAVYSHRGAYLQALSNALMFGLNFDSVYLWTLPMFHCSGWSYPWAVVAVGGTQVCLRKVDTAMIFQFIAQHHVTHLCGAPIVLNMLAQAPAAQRVAFSHTVNCATGGAAPPSSVLRAMEEIGFRVTHLYGATETYGPALSCVAQPEWNDLPPEQRYANMARQGVAYPDRRRPDGRGSRNDDAGAAGRHDDGRTDDARQHGDEGIPREP